MRAAAENSFARVPKPHGDRVYCHPQTDCLRVCVGVCKRTSILGVLHRIK